jgi:signal transduction histidine kinase/DNA-binding NarL/FixJ family response regulator
VWLVFNVLIAILLMVMGVFEALDQVLGLYSHLAVAWVGAVVADLVICKPLGLSPKNIEFRRAYLFDINPTGFGAMLLASALSVATYAGAFGQTLRPASAAVALLVALVAAPLIALATRSRYAMAREPADFGERHRVMRCAICRNKFESDDMAQCPAYGGPICSLCCTLDARCGDRCKPGSRIHEQLTDVVRWFVPAHVSPEMIRRVGQYSLVLIGSSCVFGAMLWLLHAQERLRMHAEPMPMAGDLDVLFWKVFAGVFLLIAVVTWWLVLANESRHVAQEESDRQNQLLQREIDAHRQTDAALQRAKEVAESASLAKSRFVTGMSHEMRSPLNSILGYSQVLLRQKMLDAQSDAVSTIHRSGEHLASLVDGLLELSRIEAGKLRLEQEAVDLREFLDQIVKMLQPMAEAKSLAFHYELDGKLPARVHADPKRLRQILINLLGNAVKFTEQGSVSLRVRYRREIAHITIADTGIGIAQADHERIFQPFERGAGPSDIEGTGLGLTITRLLVDLMGGDIQLKSSEGEGSRFSVRVYLPALSAAETRVAHSPIRGYAGVVRRVLVVDDEAAHRGVLRGMLQPLGFAISDAASGAECLALIGAMRADEQPHLILLDINLRDTTGWAVCRQLRDTGFRAPIVMVSANAHENTELAHSPKSGSGSSGFVVKPVTEADLLHSVREVLDLQWIREGEHGVPVTAPPRDVLRELLALSAGGYPRALRARFTELQDESPECEAWIARLLPLIEHDIREFNARLTQALNDETQIHRTNEAHANT